MENAVEKKRILSGIQPSGDLTLGSYLGAIRNWAAMSDEYDCYYMLADMHTITVRQVPADLRRHTLTQVVADERTSIMDSVTEKASQQMKEFGIEIVDVRIKRTDLPAENQRAIFDRMRAERERQATQYRSEGAEESTKIRSGAEKERAVILAEAGKKAAVIRGEGDAEAARIYAEAFSQSPEFFSFQRGLEALRKSLGENTRMVLTPDSPLLQPIK